MSEKLEEKALVRVYASLESLLRWKAPEVALLKSGMTERSWVRRKSKDHDGPHYGEAAAVKVEVAATAPSNYARVERTAIWLYSMAASS